MAITNSQPDANKKAAPEEKQPGKTGEIFLGFISFLAFIVLLISYWAVLRSSVSSFWQGFPAYVLRWDVLTFTALSTLICAANLEVWKKNRNGPTIDSFKDNDPEYKHRTYHLNLFNYSGAALKDTSSSYITAVSILIPASFVIIQVAKSVEPAELSEEVTLGIPLVFRGVVWFLISLFFGILALYSVFTHGRHQDLSKSLPMNVLLGSQFISLFIGVLWLAGGLYHVVSR